jgi:hypothetical protein
MGDIEQMFEYPLYSDLMSKADRRIDSLAQKFDMSPDQSIRWLHNWIEMPTEMLRFALLGDRSPDTIWRSAYQYDGMVRCLRASCSSCDLGDIGGRCWENHQRIKISLHSKGRNILIEHFEVTCNFVSTEHDNMEPQKTKDRKKRKIK